MHEPAPLTPYTPRPIHFLGVVEVNGYQLKKYSIVYGHQPLVDTSFDDAFAALAATQLPRPPIMAGRPGLGFVIFHQGRTGDYVVLGWWDRENELPIRIVVRDIKGWRHARGHEGVCVWDLEVIWHERCAYVETMLKSGVESPADEYCKRFLPQ